MQIEVFLDENPTIEKPASTTIVVDGENNPLLPQRKSASKKGKKSITDNNPPSMSRQILVEEEEEESVEVPLIRKRGETSKARSTTSESIIQRPVSERMPTNRVTGESFVI